MSNFNISEVCGHEEEHALAIARVLVHIDMKAAMHSREDKQKCFQQLGLTRVEKEWGKPTTEAAIKKIKQPHDRAVFEPMSLN